MDASIKEGPLLHKHCPLGCREGQVTAPKDLVQVCIFGSTLGIFFESTGPFENGDEPPKLLSDDGANVFFGVELDQTRRTRMVK